MALDLTRVDPDSADAIRELEARVISLETAPPPAPVVGTDLPKKQIVTYESGLVVAYEKVPFV